MADMDTPRTTTQEWPTEQEQHESWLADVALAECPECGSPVGRCYFICPRSPRYYSAEQEREDTRWNDSLGQDEWFRLAVAQYEREHGEAYVS